MADQTWDDTQLTERSGLVGFDVRLSSHRISNHRLNFRAWHTHCGCDLVDVRNFLRMELAISQREGHELQEKDGCIVSPPPEGRKIDGQPGFDLDAMLLG